MSAVEGGLHHPSEEAEVYKEGAKHRGTVSLRIRKSACWGGSLCLKL